MVKKRSAPPPPETENTEETETDEAEKRPVFRNPNYQHATMVSGKKKTWRSLKQVAAQERMLSGPSDAPYHSSRCALPSMIPAKKYSDISGLQAKYTDPQTKLFFANSEEFATIRSLPSDIIAGYLTLRGANNPIG